MAHAVEDHLHHRALVAIGAARLGHPGEREAVARAEAIGRIPSKAEG